ncbi:MAG: pyridoxamine 5'-phosphate oxidase family protein [Tannerella sp.]|jgi:nitroimidazol reductase NimA-like FMN-containing flavoprotein (pyridoxamine 5'-phosphate oxidase superfamily)|nr:pyridoxamine 5'-phosphate oxidase family protein [Tannerella sp.]
MKTIVHTDQETIDGVIRQCEICFVGMADTDGMPYVLPMNFGYEDGVLFLHSGREGTHVEIIGRNPHVCVLFNTANELVCQHPDVACSYRMRSQTVIGWGQVEFEEDFERKTQALDILMKHYSDRRFRYSRPAVVHTQVWRIRMERVSCRAFGVPHG